MKHTFIFGVFSKGKLVFPLGTPLKCSHITAAIIVGILDMAKSCLQKGYYFAADYQDNFD